MGQQVGEIIHSLKDRPAHPFPQLARSHWIDLCGAWDFAYDDDDRGLNEAWQDRADIFDRGIQVPFPPESAKSGIGDSGFHPVVWYRRAFMVEPSDVGKRLILHCGAIDYHAQVWVNGRPAATHQGGHTPFSVDITDALRPSGEQHLVIRAEDAPTDLAQPRGKQDWCEQPHGIWYHRSTGIWQPVWLEAVHCCHIAALHWTPQLDRAALGLTIRLSQLGPAAGCKPTLHVRVRLSLRGNVVADDTFLATDQEIRREIGLDQACLTTDPSHILWAPEHPNLIDATITLLDGDEIVDEVQSYAGLRSVGTAQGQFLLNGHPYYLRLALEQGYWPDSQLAAPSEAALYQEVAMVKALGFNGVRIHQKVEDPRFLAWCDRLGVLVWGEMANAYVFSREAVERLAREWMAVLERDHSHPCIVAWVPINESWGVPQLATDPAQRHAVHALYHLTRALDPTRPVLGNDGWEYVAGDVIGIHDYAFFGKTLLRRYGSAEALQRTLREDCPGDRLLLLTEPPIGTPIMITEFGGISFAPDPDAAWFGYGTVADHAAFAAKYRELIDAVLDCPTIAGFCYTQLTDTLQETNGLLSENREPKIDPEEIRAITGRRPGAYPEVPNQPVGDLTSE